MYFDFALQVFLCSIFHTFSHFHMDNAFALKCLCISILEDSYLLHLFDNTLLTAHIYRILISLQTASASNNVAQSPEDKVFGEHHFS